MSQVKRWLICHVKGLIERGRRVVSNVESDPIDKVHCTEEIDAKQRVKCTRQGCLNE